MKTTFFSIILLAGVFVACSSIERKTASEEQSLHDQYPSVGEKRFAN